jgi:hypothetical protein
MQHGERQAPALKEVDLGEKTVLVNPATGEPVREFPNTARPGASQPVGRWSYGGVDPKTGEPLLLNSLTGETRPGGGMRQNVAGRPTDGQLAAGMFAERMSSAEKLLRQHEAQGKPNVATATGGSLPFLGGALRNMVSSREQQMYRQAQEDWVRAKLRKESGAVIGVGEMNDEIRTYFPQIGDSPAVIEQKRQRREEATRLLRASAGAAGKLFTPADSTQAPPSGNPLLQGSR